MAQVISIGSTRYAGLLKARLGREMELFLGNGLKVNLAERSEGGFTFLTCRLADAGKLILREEEARGIFKYYLANIIADIIINHWEDLLIREIIQENYYYFTEEDKDLIYRNTLTNINRDKNGLNNPVFGAVRKNKIMQKVIDYLNGSNRIILDGFVRFRLKEYIDELRDAADKAVDDFLMEREYREFIQLLRYFVEIQEPRFEIVHVLVRADNNFALYDERLRGIKAECPEGCAFEPAGGEISYDDLFVSMLITLSPRLITIHREGGTAAPLALDTVVNVFEGRISWCPGCPLCRTGSPG
ncbi:MAG: putative sporulation protein YtxC [Firmicutes bacterium]|nr:putative sporulation protein YtxC [Bacillota bacterium]